MKAQRKQRKKGDKTQKKKNETAEKADRLNECTHTLIHSHMIIHFILLAYSLNSSTIIGVSNHAYPTLRHTSASRLSRLSNMQQLIAFVGRGFVFGQVLLPQAISQSVVAYA